MYLNLNKLQEIVNGRGAWCAAVCGLQRVKHDLVTEQQQQTVPYLNTEDFSGVYQFEGHNVIDLSSREMIIHSVYFQNQCLSIVVLCL